METRIETITPKMAAIMLEGNETNRKVNEAHVIFLSKQMKEGNWHLTGDTIKIDKFGILLDGQHRLHACIKAGVAFKNNISRGVERIAFKFIDTGRNRSAGDVLSIEKISNANNMAGLIKFIIHYRIAPWAAASNNTGGGNKRKVTNNDVSEFYHKNEAQLLDSYPCGYNKHNKLLNGSVLAGMHFILKKIDYEQATEFCLRLSDGQNLKPKSPIYVLRERLIYDRTHKLKLGNYDKLALIIKAWNAFRNKKSISGLRYNKANEEFPKPI